MSSQAPNKNTLWTRFFRPILVYFSVCFGIGLFLTFGLENKYQYSISLIIYILSSLWFGIVIFCYTIIPSIIILHIIKVFQIPRGYADILTGGLVGLLLPLFLLGSKVKVWIPLFSEWKLGMQYGLLLSTSIGALAGLTYWLLSGWPRDGRRR